MSNSQNLYIVLGASLIGAVCAAAVFIAERFHDRRKISLDLARVNRELNIVKQDLDNVLRQQKKNRTVGRKNRKVTASSVTSEDYLTPLELDSSDLEFYDISDDDEVDRLDLNLEEDLELLDATIDNGSQDDLNSSLLQLQNLSTEFPKNPQLLWRIARVHHKLLHKTHLNDHIDKGIQACMTALELKPELANVHKWLAIHLGEKCKSDSLREKIVDGDQFKLHLDRAVELAPTDSMLHYMLGRFAYDVAHMKWLEKKLANTLLTHPMEATYQQALDHFLEAVRLSASPSKENLLYIGKCHVQLGAIQEAVEVLRRAQQVTSGSFEEETDTEIHNLLEEHNKI